MLPPGAERIHSLRENSQRPAGAVVCSLIGDFNVEFEVRLDLETEWDLLWAIDLDVIVAAHNHQAKGLGPLLLQFRRHRPKMLYLWLEDIGRAYDVRILPTEGSIGKPVSEWVWRPDLFRLTKWEESEIRAQLTGMAA
jgi:hypothetical protein